MSIHFEFYIIHLSIFQIIIYHFYEINISLKDSLDHYELNHTTIKDHSISMKIRYEIIQHS